MRKRVRRLLQCGVLLVGVLIAVLLTLPGCPPPVAPGPTPYVPAKMDGLPTIRVLVGAGEGFSISTTGGYRFLADGREVARSLEPLSELQLRRMGMTWTLNTAVFTGQSLTVEAGGNADHLAGRQQGWSFVQINKKDYRGKIVLLGDGTASNITAVNHIDLESYLAGVLSRELLAGWHDRAYEALAIAARTYALYEMGTVGKGRAYDVRDDQGSQVYGGRLAETDKSWRAVRATHGQVVAFGPQGQERIFRAQYSSCCGGRVNNACFLYGQPVSGPLVGGQICEDCRLSGRYRWPQVIVPKAVIARAVKATYPNCGLTGVAAVRVAEEMYDRPVWLDIISTDGKKVRLRANDLRLCLLRDPEKPGKSLYSMNCTIRDAGDSVIFENGQGFGHGVGLCQWGTEGKAQRGFTVAEILAAYYPGSRLFTAY